MTGGEAAANTTPGKSAGIMSRSCPTRTAAIIKRGVRRTFSKETLFKRLPITSWLPKYNLECFEGDLMAGFTVGLTVIPQGIAYAVVAGLPPNYGLYSSFMGCFMYLIFGSCKDITIGPTAIMAIMTHEYSGNGGPDFAVLLCFLTGLIILAAGFCNLGFLINFISKPVICGFTSAAAITIASSQLKGLFGLSYSSDGIIETYKNLFKHIGETRWQDLTLGISTIIILLLLRKLKDLKAVKVQVTDEMKTRIWKKCVFLLSVGRNAIVVIIALIIAYALDHHQPFIITGEVQPGLPAFKVPPFSTVINGTNLTFSDMVLDVGSGIAVIPLISIIESIAIASAFSGGKTIDATQEMFALGFCNLVGSFAQSMPVTGSFTRTAVNATSGVKTPAGGIVTGILVILALAFLTAYFKFIPKASLAAVIICAVIFMIEYDIVVPVWKARRLDELTLWGSFLCCLFWKLEYGILVGAGINLAILLFGIARPKVKTDIIKKQDGDEPAYVVVEPTNGLFYPSVEYVRATVSKAGLTTGQGSLTVVVDCSHFTGIDFTAAKGLGSLCLDFEKRQQNLVFTNVPPSVKKGLQSINEDIKIATSPDELHSLLRSSYPAAAVNITCTTGRSSTGVSRLEGEDPDLTNPLLEVSTLPKPVICERET
ncbi:sodium-independent sulfate anion transporter isoform X2 [Procambarus clarkii]|uniref:sodium-independent sulfate anion transporter isoform X2 n=1 Tax=Procambarus clarkii TaxID=6728 RepID=UPI00374406E0